MVEAPPAEAPAAAAATEASGEPSLAEQVRAAISAYALGEEARLAGLFATHGLEWDLAVGKKLVETASKQIGASVESRGETSYALVTADGAANRTRIASVHKYLEKLVAKRAEKMLKPK